MAVEPVEVSDKTIDLPNIKVNDALGTPIVVSGVLTYAVINSKKAIIDVKNYRTLTNNLSMTALK